MTNVTLRPSGDNVDVTFSVLPDRSFWDHRCVVDSRYKSAFDFSVLLVNLLACFNLQRCILEGDDLAIFQLVCFACLRVCARARLEFCKFTMLMKFIQSLPRVDSGRQNTLRISLPLDGVSIRITMT